MGKKRGLEFSFYFISNIFYVSGSIAAGGKSPGNSSGTIKNLSATQASEIKNRETLIRAYTAASAQLRAQVESGNFDPKTAAEFTEKLFSLKTQIEAQERLTAADVQTRVLELGKIMREISGSDFEKRAKSEREKEILAYRELLRKGSRGTETLLLVGGGLPRRGFDKRKLIDGLLKLAKQNGKLAGLSEEEYKKTLIQLVERVSTAQSAQDGGKTLESAQLALAAHVGTDPTKVYIMDTRGAGSAPDPAVGAGSVDSEQRAGGAQDTQSLANSLGDALLARGLDVKSGGSAFGSGSGGAGLLTGSSYLTEAEWTQIATLKPKLIDEYPELQTGTSATGAIVTNTPAPPEAPASETNPTWLTTPSRGPASLDEEPAAPSAPVVAPNNPTVAAAPSSRNTQNKSSSLEDSSGSKKGASSGSGNQTPDPTAGYLPTPIAPPAHGSSSPRARRPDATSKTTNPMATAMANNRGLADEGAKAAPKQEAAPAPNPSTAPSSVLKASTNTALTNELYGLIQFARGNGGSATTHSEAPGRTRDGVHKPSDGVSATEATSERDSEAMNSLKELGITPNILAQVETATKLLGQKTEEFNNDCQPTLKSQNKPSKEQCAKQLVDLEKKENKKSIEECLALKVQINSLQIKASLLVGTALNIQKEKEKRLQAKNKNKKKPEKPVASDEGVTVSGRMGNSQSQWDSTVQVSRNKNRDTASQVQDGVGNEPQAPFDIKKMTEQASKISEEFRSFYQASVKPKGDCEDEEDSSDERGGGGDFLGALQSGLSNSIKAEAFSKAVASRDFLFGLLASSSPNCFLFDSQSPPTSPNEKSKDQTKPQQTAQADPCKAGIENSKNPTELDKLKTLAFFYTIESLNDLGEPNFVEKLFGTNTPDPFTREFKGSKAMLAYKRVEEFLFKEKFAGGENFLNFLLGCDKESNGPLNLFLSLENDLRDSAAQCGSNDALNAISLLSANGTDKLEAELFAGYYGLSKLKPESNATNQASAKTELKLHLLSYSDAGNILSTCPNEETGKAQENGFVSDTASKIKPITGRNLTGLTALGLENPKKEGQKNSQDCIKIRARYDFALGFILNNPKALEAWQRKALKLTPETSKDAH